MSENRQIPASPSGRSIPLDALGILASTLCVLGCSVLPLLAVALPFLGIGEEGPFQETLHGILIAIVVPLALLAFTRGYLMHRSKRPLILGMAGLFLLVFVYFGEGVLFTEFYERLLSLAGGGLLITAHLINRHLCICCRESSCAEPNPILSTKPESQ